MEGKLGVIRTLYEALNNRDVETVHRLLAPDLEWWFHGPPSCQHMMRLLTGADESSSFVFEPISFAVFGPTVLVEGHGYCDHNNRTAKSDPPLQAKVPWVHAWTVTADGIVTQVREYFNTSLTVTRFGGSSSSSKSQPSSSHCVPLWESRLSGGAGKKSVPGLVLAI